MGGAARGAGSPRIIANASSSIYVHGLGGGVGGAQTLGGGMVSAGGPEIIGGAKISMLSMVLLVLWGAWAAPESLQKH